MRDLSAPGILPRILCVALAALFVPRVAYPALPPGSVGSSQQNADKASAPGPTRSAATPAPGKPEGQQGEGPIWSFPVIRWGGSLAYETRKDSDERRTMAQRGLTASLAAAADTFIWQPWFAQLGGNMRFTSNRNGNDRTEIGFDSSSDRLKNLIITGTGQLRILPLSKTPFEAHIDRSDSRARSELLSVGDYSGQRIGFTQQWMRDEGDALIAFDRNTQDSESSGRDRQDSLQLSASHTIDLHRLNAMATRSRNVREATGENVVQDNITLQHNYTPIPEVTIDSTANTASTALHLQNGHSAARVSQLSSTSFWRPEEMPLTVVGSVRLLTLGTQNSGNEQVGPSSARLRNANINVGATYDYSDHVHFHAAGNANTASTNGNSDTVSTQSVGVNYQPETIRFGGGFNYNWSTSSALSNRTGGPGAGKQLTLQLSHNLNRNFAISADAALTIELNQSLALLKGNKSSNGEPAATQQVTHGGAVSWSLNTQPGTALVRLSASDTRSLDGNKEFFQLVNFQASSNLPTGNYTSWSGNLTIQAIRQGGIPAVIISPDTGLPIMLVRNTPGDDFVITSSGSLTYQNTRFFGVRQLRFTSDLRLNGQAILPVFGGPNDQEVAAWDNRLEYFIGRTQLRLSTLVARTKSPVRFVQNPIEERTEGPVRMNKSIMFTVTRQFGND